MIRVRNLSKQYQIGKAEASYGTLRESLVGVMRAPFKSLQRNGHPDTEKKIWALKNVSFEVKPGEVVGVIGRNGAGKSTLLKILSRITEPTRGEVDLYGRIGSLLEVGTGFHAELTGRENIYLNGSILGMRRHDIDKKFDEIVAYAEVEQFIDTPVKKYSTGMYLRLAFAVAAHLEPEVLVIDEVLAVGDASFQKKCLKKIDDIAHEGRTVLFVSHNMNAIEQLCTQALLLDRGHIREFDTDVRRVIKQYLFVNDESELADWIAEDNQFKNNWFSPLRFFVCDREGQKLVMPVSNDADVWLHIEGVVEQLDPALTVGYAVYSEEGYLIFWSFHTDQEPERWPHVNKGHCVFKTKIPKRFLNEGLYRIELLASLHHRIWLLQPGVKAPSINLIIQGGLSDSPHWMAKRPGLLAPVLEWNLMSRQ